MILVTLIILNTIVLNGSGYSFGKRTVIAGVCETNERAAISPYQIAGQLFGSLLVDFHSRESDARLPTARNNNLRLSRSPSAMCTSS